MPRRRRSLPFFACLATLAALAPLAPRAALAQDEGGGLVVIDQSQTQAVPPPGGAPAGDPAGVHEHDGLYVRVGLGVGLVRDSFEGPLGFFDGTATGPSGALELMIGGTLAPGLVVGGGLFIDWVQNPEIEIDGRTVDSNVEVGALTGIGPFVDYYFDPLGGLHVQAGLAFASLSLDDGDPATDDQAALGFAGYAGFGHEWWVGDQWGLGVLGRLSAARLEEDESGLTHAIVAVSVLASLTFH